MSQAKDVAEHFATHELVPSTTINNHLPKNVSLIYRDVMNKATLRKMAYCHPGTAEMKLYNPCKAFVKLDIQ